jgi:hypothetical protein
MTPKKQGKIIGAARILLERLPARANRPCQLHGHCGFGVESEHVVLRKANSGRGTFARPSACSGRQTKKEDHPECSSKLGAVPISRFLLNFPLS